jgi:predicted transcriptional regulator
MKSIILSVSPQEAVNVLNGKASMLLRKRIPKGFVGWCNLYVGKGKPLLTRIYDEYCLTKYGTKRSQSGNVETLNTTIPARFWFDECEEITLERKEIYLYEDDYEYQTVKLDATQLMEESCLNNQELENYLGDLIGYKAYAIPIKNLEIFDRPKALGEFYKVDNINPEIVSSDGNFSRITNPPKNFIYVEEE